jgi:cell shape-determining protein MreD
MRPALALLALGWLAVIVQGGLALLLPGWAVPELALLVTLAVASALEPGFGLGVAAGIGLGGDMVSSPPLGQLAFLRLLELTLARLVSSQLDLRRGLPLMVFAFAVVLFDGLAQIVLGRLLLGSFPLQPIELLGLLGRALVSAPLAPAAVSLARRLRERLDESEARRDMRLDTRRPVLR